MLKKNLFGLGLAGLMAISAVTPAMAANTGDKGATNVADLDAAQVDNGKVSDAGSVKDTNGTAIDPSAKKTFEALHDDEDSKSDVDYYNGKEFKGRETEDGKTNGPLKGADGKGKYNDDNAEENNQKTEVGVQQAAQYVVTIPAFISLNGDIESTEDGEKKNQAEFYVGVKANVPGSVGITVAPDLSDAQAQKVAPLATLNDGRYAQFTKIGFKKTLENGKDFDKFLIENEATNNKITENKVSGEGSFAMYADDQVKGDLKATIKMDDCLWTIKKDDSGINTIGDSTSTPASYSASVMKKHNGTIEVDKLTSGTFRNVIDFDIHYFNADDNKDGWQ